MRWALSRQQDNAMSSPTNHLKHHHGLSWEVHHHWPHHILGLGAGDSLLDFGCGTGETTIAMAQVWADLHHHHYHRHLHDCEHLHHHHHDCEQGVLGKLGNPGKVLGVDISDEMISHCSEHYDGQQNLSFQVVFKTRFEWGWKDLLMELPNLTQFLSRPWTFQTEETSAKQKSPPSTWQVQQLPNPTPWNSSKVTSFSCLHWVPNQPDAVSLFNKVLKPGGKFLFVVSRAFAKLANMGELLAY